jgi:hypothetical protein
MVASGGKGCRFLEIFRVCQEPPTRMHPGVAQDRVKLMETFAGSYHNCKSAQRCASLQKCSMDPISITTAYLGATGTIVKLSTQITISVGTFRRTR